MQKINSIKETKVDIQDKTTASDYLSLSKLLRITVEVLS